MHIRLSEHFSCTRLIAFTAPSIANMLFLSVYMVVDGFFIARYAGKTSFAAVNLIMPYLCLFLAAGAMFGSGGTALASRLLGEGRPDEARGVFSLSTAATIASSLAVAVPSFVWMGEIGSVLGAAPDMLPDCILYGRVCMAALPAFMLQTMFQSFFVAAERPGLGFLVTAAAGMTNIVLDAVFIPWFGLGLMGAALATAVSQIVGGVFPLVWFMRSGGTLRLGRPAFRWAFLGKVCGNGISECLTNIAFNISAVCCNFQLMRLAGEDGVAVFGAIMYISFVFVSMFFGFGMGMAPVVSYHYGAGNTQELAGLFRKGMGMSLAGGAVLCVVSWFAAGFLSELYLGGAPELIGMSERAFRLYGLSYFPIGVGIFASAFFTALNDGAVSGFISTMRTLVFQCAALFTLPYLFGLDGVWCSKLAAEVLSAMLAIWILRRCGGRYGYLPGKP